MAGEERPLPSERVTISEEARQCLLMERIKSQALQQVNYSEAKDLARELLP